LQIIDLLHWVFLMHKQTKTHTFEIWDPVAITESKQLEFFLHILVHFNKVW
jgi:hypothetical protein